LAAAARIRMPRGPQSGRTRSLRTRAGGPRTRALTAPRRAQVTYCLDHPSISRLHALVVHHPRLQVSVRPAAGPARAPSPRRPPPRPRRAVAAA